MRLHVLNDTLLVHQNIHKLISHFIKKNSTFYALFSLDVNA